MTLFQQSVLNKYLKTIDSKTIESAWQTFTNHFHNPTIQENIRNSKEEQYQRGFLVDLFVNVLGYTINPEPNFNLTTELKNVKDAKKTDGAILKDGNAIAVIELKGMNTTDLSGKVEVQAFGYKNNQPHAVYVITSNFQKLRFYIDKAIEFESFDLFNLDMERFKILWLCLSKDSLLQGIPKKIKDESLTIEETITKKLYKDYSAFKNAIFGDLVVKNPEQDKLTLYKKTQKLLDRFLFIFFAEDKGLLPPNSIRAILKQWEQLKELDEYKPLYQRYQKYFGYLNTGHKGKHHDIFAYNGGLFKPDSVLDHVSIDDDILYQHTLKLSDYDFNTEVSVNILGHIFEHSLNEIEEITAQIEGKEIDTKKTKRKKDGVFYTPKYITKYIVDNTVGKLCNEKKQSLGIEESEYNKDRKGRKKAKLKELDDKLQDYRNWLLNLTICDPACGSGAFLNQALEFLISEHGYIDELQTKLLGGGFIFPNVKNAILENNLFGVDINDESVEIAKLSLWLRTAEKGRKLTSLSNNLKVGNSLIDDPDIAGVKAFTWEKEFPQVFDKGGFDVVIGNPPYTYRNAIEKEEKSYFKNNYKSIEGNFDLYKFFMEIIVNIVKEDGLTSFIVPNTFLSAKTYKKLRNILVNNFEILELFDLGLDVFESVVVENIIFQFRRKQTEKQETLVKIQRDRKRNFYNLEKKYTINLLEYAGNEKTFNIYISNETKKIVDLMQKNSISLGEICYCTVGINTGYIKNELTSKIKIDDRFHKMLNGKNIGRNTVSWDGEWIMYDVDFVKSKGDRGRSLPPKNIFEDEKILVQRTRRGMKRKLVCYYDNEQYYNLNRISNIVLTDNNFDLKYIYLLLNSELMDYYFNNFFNEYEVKPLHLSKLPIYKVEQKTQLSFVNKAEHILKLNRSLQSVMLDFIDYLQAKHDLPKISKKMNTWYLLEEKDFLKELKKAKVKIEGMEEFNLLKVFKSEKEKALNIKAIIDQTDKEIDRMVYELYGLTEDEIKIVESN